MDAQSPRPKLIERLRAQIADAGAPLREVGCLPFGIDALDARLSGRGLSRSALHEVSAAGSGLVDDAAATLFLAGIAARLSLAGEIIVWAVTRFDLFSPGLEQVGLHPDRTLFVEAREDKDVLAVMEDSVRHGSLAAVVGEVRRADMTATRRLQLAAGERAVPVFLFRRWRRSGACPLTEPSAATTRWRIASAPSAPLGIPGVGTPRWNVELVRQRNGAPFSLIMEGCDATGRLALPAAAPDRAAVAAGTTARAA
ncbi:protein ImuA [Sphingomonas sp. BIUV-7]|uniref:Protein ImuA n=1 Tax=Sphingomonas natans TaxID=3063330 RepID=A0ABT8Y8G6_9SPHN|nr:protein ImuA [Sphingomonas sp. BIUV-7]MDO6414623.1 protein ImuA [Sphingomonas sp. BIUV-7]